MSLTPRCAVRRLAVALVIGGATVLHPVAAQSSPPDTQVSVFGSDTPLDLTIRADRVAIEALYDVAPLERGHAERARRYYDDFFLMIDDPRRLRREMRRSCQ